MNILDIKFMGDKAYLLKKCTINVEGLKTTIKSFDYSKLYDGYREYKDEYGVEKVKLPPINFVFYKYLFENDSIPSPHDMIILYFQHYSDMFIISGSRVEMNGEQYNLNAVISRILRTYPSLIRDFHFYLMLKESNTFDKVTYSCADDINGIDISIVHDDKKYVVSLYTDTKRAWGFKRLKNLFRHKYQSNEIKVPLNMSEAEKCGDFMLYREKDIDIIKNRLSS